MDKSYLDSPASSIDLDFEEPIEDNSLVDSTININRRAKLKCNFAIQGDFELIALKLKDNINTDYELKPNHVLLKKILKTDNIILYLNFADRKYLSQINKVFGGLKVDDEIGIRNFKSYAEKAVSTKPVEYRYFDNLRKAYEYLKKKALQASIDRKNKKKEDVTNSNPSTRILSLTNTSSSPSVAHGEHSTDRSANDHSNQEVPEVIPLTRAANLDDPWL